MKSFVGRPRRWHKTVSDLVKTEHAKSILDYGCGPGRELSKFLDISVVDYDPGVSGIDTALQMQCDIVVANHVLENVEKECINEVLEHLRSLTLKVLYFSVACNPSKKVFADNTQVPRFARNPKWWMSKLTPLFSSIEVLENSAAELIILGRK